MGLIGTVLNLIFGSGNKQVRDTIEVFRENTEGQAVRGQELRIEAMKQYAGEMEAGSAGLFDRVMDGVNRLPRPLLAIGTLGLFLSAMVDPIWFAARMQGIALVPEPLWWLLGVIVSFYFGARHQAKSQQFQRSIAKTVSSAPQVIQNIRDINNLRPTAPGAADPGPDTRLSSVSVEPDHNPALDAIKSRA